MNPSLVLLQRQQQAKANVRFARAQLAQPIVQRPQLKPLDFNARSANELRPQTFAEMVGQERLKRLMGRIVAACKTSGRPLDHMLMTGASGTGKTTLAQVVACELGRRVFQLKAPVTQDIFEELARVGQDGDVVIVDEIHLQVSGDRRGVTQAADPEAFFTCLEDRRLMTATGMIAFPSMTFIGCTTDQGLLPEPFLNRFPLRPQLDPYTEDEMAQLALSNAHALQLGITDEARIVFAKASRCNPRQLNTYIRNARSLSGAVIDDKLAREVVEELNSTTADGLTDSMQRMLRVLLQSKRTVKGDTVYRASVNTVATRLGFSRDTKAVSLFVEPFLMERGLVAVAPQGRELTPTGIRRAKEL
jgi:Holliday junction resolvasome, helicase subunit